MTKTKAELETEIKELKAQLSNQEKVEQCDKAASDLRQMYESYVNAGFSEAQAWEMLTIQLSGAVQPKRTLF